MRDTSHERESAPTRLRFPGSGVDGLKMRTIHARALPRRWATGVAGATAGAALLVGLTCVGPAAASTRPAAPSSLTVVTHGSSSYLSWKGQAAPTYVVQQATDRAFAQGVTSYKMRGPGKVFTPYRISRGTTYYFRVRAMRAGTTSRPSNIVAMTAHGVSAVRVLSYNTLSATFDGEKHPGGTVAPFSQRRGPQLSLMLGSKPDVIGVQEAASCLHKRPHTTCYRQIDSLAAGLKPTYRLANTLSTAEGDNRYANNYILYGDRVTPVGHGGTWLIGPSNPERFAAYHAFKVTSTGAEFLFVDLHLISPAGASYDQTRGDETQSVLRQSRAYAQSLGIASIVYVGDFNSYYNEWHVNDITGSDMRAAGIPDGIAVAQRRVLSKYDSINAYYRHPRQGHGSADHVYATGGVGVKTWGELLHLSHGDFAGTIPSDHNPVYADLAMPY